MTSEEAGPHLSVTDSEHIVVYAHPSGNVRAVELFRL